MGNKKYKKCLHSRKRKCNKRFYSKFWSNRCKI